MLSLNSTLQGPYNRRCSRSTLVLQKGSQMLVCSFCYTRSTGTHSALSWEDVPSFVWGHTLTLTLHPRCTMDAGAEANMAFEGTLTMCHKKIAHCHCAPPQASPLKKWKGVPWSLQTSLCMRVQSLTVPACRGISNPSSKCRRVAACIVKHGAALKQVCDCPEGSIKGRSTAKMGPFSYTSLGLFLQT